VEQLRVRAQEATAMEVTIKQNEEKIVTLETQYREETVKRPPRFLDVPSP
jgi:hypothetical protein